MRYRKPTSDILKEADIQHVVDLLWVDMQLAVQDRDLDRILLTYKQILRIYPDDEETIQF